MLALFTLFLGLILGLTLAILTLWIIKVKCPKCKQLRSIKEIVVFNRKQRMITGQPCLKCRQIRPQVEIF